MSNQVFSGPLPRYFPASAQSDVFTLTKNNAGPPAYGSMSGSLVSAGANVVWNRLNGNDCTITGGKYNFSSFQRAQTLPYWVLSSNTAYRGGGVLLTSTIDQTIGVDIVAPLTIAGYGTQSVQTKVMVMVLDSNLVNSRVVAMDDYAQTSGSATIQTHGVCGIVQIAAGESIVVMIAGNIAGGPGSYVMQDDPNGQSTLLIEASCRFIKL